MLRNINIAVFEHVKKTAEFVKAYGKGIELTKKWLPNGQREVGWVGEGSKILSQNDEIKSDTCRDCICLHNSWTEGM